MFARAALALLLLVVLSPLSIIHASCVDALAALAALALLLLVVLAPLLWQFLLLSLLLPCLQCLQLSFFSRFPFHDSQVSQNGFPSRRQWVWRKIRSPIWDLLPGGLRGVILESFWSHFGDILGAILESV